jgi:hypothetical protein
VSQFTAEGYYTPERIIFAAVMFFIAVVFTFAGERLFWLTIVIFGFLFCGLITYGGLTETTDVSYFQH